MRNLITNIDKETVKRLNELNSREIESSDY